MEAWELAVACAGSFVAGYLGSAIGLVLGTLRLPLILLLSGDPSSGAGTNIAISTASAASGSVRHARAGRIDWRVVAWMTPPSVAGALVGGLFGHALPERLLLGGVAVVLAWNGADLLFRPFRERARPAPRLAPAVVLGFGIGVVGGAIGVILGTVRVPALLRAVGLPVGRVVGTNLVVGAFLGAFGFVGHAVRGEVAWWVLLAGLVGAIPGGWLGAKATGRFSEAVLRQALGVALLVIAAAFVVEIAVG